ncbi:unnamed protein product [Macrosiphum euphorbiae]|uniref:Uncharacterized protein n=1 Tax=Macrosiphum euphorbiae TaxID=13131 RepID=A0AAV0XXH7_9HEMI|nr:unnamed protein product [Macrosiphum euphorbiae]
MAEVVDDIIKTLNGTNGADTESVIKIIPATTEGMLIANISLAVMCLVPIFFASFRSVELHIKNKMKKGIPESTAESMTEKDAMMFPVISSGNIIMLYIIISAFSKEHINLFVTVNFYVLGVAAISDILGTKFYAMLPKSIPKTKYQLRITEGTGEKKHDWINVKFTLHDVLFFVSCATLGTFYIISKHWIVNNIFGLAFA